MFVSDIKRDYGSYGLPERFVDCLPEFCTTCGAPLEIRETLTGLCCSNPRCRDKLVMRTKSICNDLGILNFGESTIEKFLDYYGVTNPLNIFDLKLGMELSPEVSLEVSRGIIEQIVSRKDFTLWEYVMVANIPYVRTSAKKIFKGYSNLSDAYSDIENGGVDFIQKRLGIYNEGEVSLQAMKMYHSLMEFKDDLLEGEELVNIIDLSGLQELNVVCSDQVGGGFARKKDFYEYVNKLFKDKVHVNFLPNVKKGIDYLIWAGADGSPARYTSKVQTVEKYNEKGSNIPIVTAEQFIEQLREWVF